MKKLPLNIKGLLIQRIEKIAEPSWQPFWFDVHYSFSDPRVQQLISADGSPDSPWVASAACLAARLGRLNLANRLIDSWMDNTIPKDAAQAKILLREERRNARKIVSHRREWPKDVFHLEDTPAWMIPAFCKLRSKLFGAQEYRILSGGHLLDNRVQDWHVSYSGHARHVDEPPSFATATWT